VVDLEGDHTCRGLSLRNRLNGKRLLLGTERTIAIIREMVGGKPRWTMTDGGTVWAFRIAYCPYCGKKLEETTKVRRGMVDKRLVIEYGNMMSPKEWVAAGKPAYKTLAQRIREAEEKYDEQLKEQPKESNDD